MTEEALRELCPLAALGALDAPERAAFLAESMAYPAVRRELSDFERLVAQLGLATLPVPPSAALRSRVLAVSERPTSAAARVPATPSRPSPLAAGSSAPTPSWRVWLPLAAALVLGTTALVWRGERNDARRDAARAEAETRTAEARNHELQDALALSARRLAEADAFRTLVTHPASRVAGLAGLPAAPAARAKVVWNADRREAVLLASGLPPAPPGKVYEAWVIAGGAPVAAGVFRPGESGGAYHALPLLDEVSRARTFAVTVEPEGGTTAPTGPMVLAGPAL